MNWISSLFWYLSFHSDLIISMRYMKQRPVRNKWQCKRGWLCIRDPRALKLKLALEHTNYKRRSVAHCDRKPTKRHFTIKLNLWCVFSNTLMIRHPADFIITYSEGNLFLNFQICSCHRGFNGILFVRFHKVGPYKRNVS